MAKRSIAVILSLVLALSGLPVFASVETKAAVGDTFTVDGKAGYKILWDDDEKKYAELSWMEDTLTDGVNLPDTVNYNGT
ncbi:MAG: hypothetical protein K6A45_07090, partial [Lachnospiraceae bacterium]|nr:hypothetical protein [Lachnospiraceae bacterium]